MKKEIRKITTLALLGSTALTTAACQFHARSAEAYRDVTQELLLTRQNEIKACYDELLKKDSKAGGIVQLTFTVENESGKIKDAKVDPNGTTAPTELGDCVVNAISGLVLTPPDKRDGLATFSYEFKPNG